MSQNQQDAVRPRRPLPETPTAATRRPRGRAALVCLSTIAVLAGAGVLAARSSSSPTDLQLVASLPLPQAATPTGAASPAQEPAIGHTGTVTSSVHTSSLPTGSLPPGSLPTSSLPPGSLPTSSLRAATLAAAAQPVAHRATAVPPARPRARAVAAASGVATRAPRGVTPIARGHYVLGARWGQHGSWSHWHTGEDFPAEVGTPVRAVADGVVTLRCGSCTSWAGSSVVVIRHPDGGATLYAHMDRASVTEGQRVSAGSPIGVVGMKGRTFGPHLHLEYYPAGVVPGDVYHSKDPLVFLASLGIRP